MGKKRNPRRLLPADPELSDQRAHCESGDVGDDDRCSCRGIHKYRQDDSQKRADYRQYRGEDRYRAEALEDPHCGQCGEDDQRGYEKGTYEVHCEHDDDSDDRCDHEVEKPGSRADCFREALIECDREKPVIKSDK